MSAKRISGVLLVWLLAFGPYSACKGRSTKEGKVSSHGDGHDFRRVNATPELLVFSRVIVEKAAGPSVLQLSRRRLADLLTSSLAASSQFAVKGVTPAERPTRAVEISLTASYDWAPNQKTSGGSLVLVVAVEISFVKERGQRRALARFRHRSEVESPDATTKTLRKSAQQKLDDLSVRAVAEIAESLLAMERLRSAPNSELVASLSAVSSVPGMKVWALQLAGDRGVAGAVPVAIASLASNDEGERAAALVALVALHAQSAVPSLVRDVDFNDYGELRVTMEAIAAIGGTDALDFLEFVASGHSDAEIQALAKENLERVKGAFHVSPDKRYEHNDF